VLQDLSRFLWPQNNKKNYGFCFAKKVFIAKSKSSGPITPGGKEIVAKNALTHGATAKYLLNDDEENRYRSILKILQKTYPNKRP
jgi:hypothetical protein